MSGLFATKGTMPCASYLKLQTADPEKDDDETDAVTTMPTRSARAAISKMRVIMRGAVLRVAQCG